MAKSFEEQINAFADKTEAKILAVAREAIDGIVEQAQTPVAKGGKMRVDTGFLRASGVGALNQMPVGPTNRRKRAQDETGVLAEYRVNGESLNLVLAKMKIGDSVYFGWTAKYAKVRETYDGFLETALQNWQNIVDVSIKKFSK